MTGRWQGPVKHDRTRPVKENYFWNLTGNHRTLVAQRPVSYSAASGQLKWSLRSGHVAVVERPDAEVQRPVNMTGASGQPALCPVKGYNDSISWGLLFKPHGQLKLTPLAIFIDIATL